MRLPHDDTNFGIGTLALARETHAQNPHTSRFATPAADEYTLAITSNTRAEGAPHEQAGHRPCPSENAAQSLCQLGGERGRPHYRGFRRRSSRGANVAVAALRRRWRPGAPQGPR